MKQITVLFFFMLGLGLNLRSDVAESFSPLSNNNFGRQQSIKETSFNQLISKTFVQSQTSLQATNDKRRRRKTPPTVPPKDPVKTSQENIEGLSKKSINFIQDDVDDDDDNNDEQSKKIDLQLMNEIAKFEFQKDKEITMGIKDAEITSTDSDQPLAIPLPDISEVKKRKQIEEELKRYEEEKEDQKVRIKRTDKEAFRRVCNYYLKSLFMSISFIFILISGILYNYCPHYLFF